MPHEIIDSIAAAEEKWEQQHPPGQGVAEGTAGASAEATAAAEVAPPSISAAQEAARKAAEKLARRDWETPPDRFNAWHNEFDFTLDLAANARNRKVDRWCGPDSPLGVYDGLDPNFWVGGERIWNNPPGFDWAWTRHIWQLMGRPTDCRPALVVQLRPANQTDQEEWRDLVERWRSGTDGEGPLQLMAADLSFHVRFLCGRVKHIPPPGIKASSPQSGHCLLIWRSLV